MGRHLTKSALMAPTGQETFQSVLGLTFQSVLGLISIQRSIFMAFNLFFWNILILKSLWLWGRVNMASNFTPRWVNCKPWYIWKRFCCYCCSFHLQLRGSLKNINRFLWFWTSSAKLLNRWLNRMGCSEKFVSSSLKQSTKIIPVDFNRFPLSSSKTLSFGRSWIQAWIWATSLSQEYNKKNQPPQVWLSFP